MVLCFYRVSVVFCLFGTAGTNCTLSRAFELLLIVGMVKKEEDSAASGQGWRFINWQLNPHINILLGESSQFQRSVFMDILLKKLGKNAEIRVASVPRMTECGNKALLQRPFPLARVCSRPSAYKFGILSNLIFFKLFFILLKQVFKMKIQCYYLFIP